MDTIVFDMTGTLTHGLPEVKDVISYDERCFPERKILVLAAAADARFETSGIQSADLPSPS